MLCWLCCEIELWTVRLCRMCIPTVWPTGGFSTSKVSGLNMQCLNYSVSGSFSNLYAGRLLDPSDLYVSITVVAPLFVSETPPRFALASDIKRLLDVLRILNLQTAIPNSKSSGSTINPYQSTIHPPTVEATETWSHLFSGLRIRTTKPSPQRSRIRNRQDNQRGSLAQSAPVMRPFKKPDVQNTLKQTCFLQLSIRGCGSSERMQPLQKNKWEFKTRASSHQTPRLQ